MSQSICTDNATATDIATENTQRTTEHKEENRDIHMHENNMNNTGGSSLWYCIVLYSLFILIDISLFTFELI